MLILAIIVFLLLSAFFSGAEIAFVSANKLGIELLKNKGSRRGLILAGFFDRPKNFIGTMLVGNNIALVVFTMLMSGLILGPLKYAFGDGFLVHLLSTIIITIVVLIFGEFLPKTLFRLYANEVLLSLSYPLAFFNFILAIPARLMTSMSNLLLRIVVSKPEDQMETVLTRVDLEHFIQDTAIQSSDDIETDMFKNALHLQQVKVKQVMVPRTEIVYIDVDSSLDELIKEFQDTKHSRILVSEGDVDNVLGYVHHQQLLQRPRNLKRLVMEIPIVPEVMGVLDLMYFLTRERTNIACVVDEFGGTSGLITLEDILEEIFGEIEDEHDDEEFIDEQISEREYLFSGRLEIDYLNEKYQQIEFPEGDYSTISGYLVMTSGTIPEQGGEIELNGYRFILELVSDTKIETVRVIKLEDLED